MLKQSAIGIFDSGVGGLTVAKAIQQLLPHERLIYFGDTLHMPYGSKSKEEIMGYSERIVDFLIQQDVKMIVIACNSASANAASYLREHFHKEVEIQGVIRPILQEVVQRPYRKIGIMGTQATMDSGIYPEILNEAHSNLELQLVAAPFLASMIENDYGTIRFNSKLLNEYLSQFRNIDALILACTHYPIIKNEVRSYMGNEVDILDNSEFMAKAVYSFLSEKHLLASSRVEENRFFVSKNSSHFANIASMFFGNSINAEERNIFAK